MQEQHSATKLIIKNKTQSHIRTLDLYRLHFKMYKFVSSEVRNRVFGVRTPIRTINEGNVRNALEMEFL